jgi:hypothetical protein
MQNCGGAGQGLIPLDRMNKPEMVRSMARRSKIPLPEAADRLDSLVHDLLDRLRHGQEAHLPGLGEFLYGRDGKIVLERRSTHDRG